MSRLIAIIYLVIGVLVAAARGYLAVKGLGDLVSLILAVLLWPLVLLGIDIRVGGGGGRARSIAQVIQEHLQVMG